MKVIKRSGAEVNFDITKIIAAIGKANDTVDPAQQMNAEDVRDISLKVEAECTATNRAVSVEEIQDMVELAIMAKGYHHVAKNYITYRYTRSLVRKSNTTDDKILSLIERSNEEAKQENANKNPVINSTQRDYMAGEVSRDLTERILLPKEIVEAHREGIIHFHDSDYYAHHMHNCFSGNERFVTDRGIRKFNSFKDGEEVTVKDKDGNLRLATVRKYGEQDMQVVTLHTPAATQNIVCTKNHRWILNDGTITTDLSVGDVLYQTQNSIAYEIESKADAEAFVIGFVIGDGVDRDIGKHGATGVRLRGEKTKYAEIFKRAGFSISQIKDSDDLYAYRADAFKQSFLNSRSWRFMGVQEKQLAFHGYYAADGSKAYNRAATADERVLAFIEDTSALAGYYISSITETFHDTEYKKNARLFYVHFIVSQPRDYAWEVVEIRPCKKKHIAWCVEEPVTHSFTLEKGIVTGNCDLVNLDDMLQNGTVITNTMIERPRSFATACNIATQIVAQVASNQYGLNAAVL